MFLKNTISFFTGYENILEYINNYFIINKCYIRYNWYWLPGIGEKQWRGDPFVICFENDCSCFIDRYPF